LAVRLDERFESNQLGWPSDPGGAARIVGGSYRLRAGVSNQFLGIRAPLQQPPSDLEVTARFRKIAGPAGGGYGVIVREQGPPGAAFLSQTGQFYVLEVSDRGEVGIWRRDGDEWIGLLSWTSSDAVRPGLEPNELAARAFGDRLTLVVNGITVRELTDGTLRGGNVGLFVGGDGNEVEAEQFTVRAR
jgi:hypothetical protein